ncbi:uncharacterized protein LOC141902467 [Tubulanus polymorphus]|uniref:uncharacterized protein LOC141902467 n=1 Tax=Tubulanus polymorphus TaxID=672921 RepID=UPI003DA4C7A6
MSSNLITCQILQDIAVLTFDCGENRLNNEFIEKFQEALNQVERNEQVKVLLTTGKGKFYSNGLDLAWCAANQNKLDEFQRKLTELTRRLLTFHLPTIAVLNGHAFAGGAFIAMCHDYIFMNEDRGWFCLNEIFLGFRLGDFFLSLLKCKVTSSHTQSQLMVFGHRFTAAEALKNQIITNHFAVNRLLEESLKYAKQLAAEFINYDPKILKAMKEDLYRPVLSNQNELTFSSHVKSNL